jgi:hypothetical protein
MAETQVEAAWIPEYEEFIEAIEDERAGEKL